MDIKFDDAQLKTMVAEGILANLTGEQREAIIGQALAILLDPTPGRYGDKLPSPLQEAFNTAVKRLSVQLATEMVEENPEIRARVKTAVTAAIETALGENLELHRVISDTVAKMLTGKDY